MYDQLTGAIVNAYDSCSRTTSINIIKKNKKWFTKELLDIKEQMTYLRFKYNCTDYDLAQL